MGLATHRVFKIVKMARVAPLSDTIFNDPLKYCLKDNDSSSESKGVLNIHSMIGFILVLILWHFLISILELMHENCR